MAGQIILGRQVRDLPEGSAVLVYADPMGKLIEQPHTAQIVGHKGGLRGDLQAEWPNDDWHYLVLWVKGERPETSPIAEVYRLRREAALTALYGED
jgi:hypothetical protein